VDKFFGAPRIRPQLHPGQFDVLQTFERSRVAEKMHNLCALKDHARRLYGNRCYGNQEKRVSWKRDSKFILVVNSISLRISHRFWVISEFCLQWDFPISGAILPHFCDVAPKVMNYGSQRHKQARVLMGPGPSGAINFLLRESYDRSADPSKKW